MMGILKRRVIRSGINIGGHHYGSSHLHDGMTVWARLDPNHPGRALIFTDDQAEYFCAALCPELAGTSAPHHVLVSPDQERMIRDIVRAAYDRGYNDARNVSAVPGDNAPGYRGRDIETERSDELLARFKHLAAILSPPPPTPRARVPGGLRRVIRSTVKVDAHTYGSPALVDGDDVFVRLDPDRPGLADIYSADQAQLIGVAFCPKLVPEKESVQ
ncbi:hypothetical protein AX761_21970 [Rhizobium sp. 58]|nr:hypothetical protein AX761_21970 [Rhizobium sp. 58]